MVHMSKYLLQYNILLVLIPNFKFIRDTNTWIVHPSTKCFQFFTDTKMWNNVVEEIEIPTVHFSLKKFSVKYISNLQNRFIISNIMS